MLVEHFVQKFAERYHKQIDHVPEALREALTDYDWPGNIRELQNFIERSVIMTSGTTLRCLARELIRSTAATSNGTLMDAERAHILAAIEATRWMVGGRNGAAARLGLPRTTLIAKMQKLGIAQTPRDRRAQADGIVFEFPIHGADNAKPESVVTELPLAEHAFA